MKLSGFLFFLKRLMRKVEAFLFSSVHNETEFLGNKVKESRQMSLLWGKSDRSYNFGAKKRETSQVNPSDIIMCMMN